MNLCLRLPWFTQVRPFVALHFCHWGTQYTSFYRYRRETYKFGFGIGRIASSYYKAIKRDPRWHPSGHWKWWYFNGTRK